MERDFYFDNAKLLLIFFVVFGHMLQQFIDDSSIIHTIYLWTYTFVMPAFIFLAGFFAKGLGHKEYIMKLTKRILLPYIIFQVVYSMFYLLMDNPNWQKSLFYPHWSLWFLPSLFSWHILLYWFKKIPARIGLTLSIFIGLIVGYIGSIGHMFSLSRTFVFFPFFLLGYWLTKGQVKLVKRKSVKVIAIFIMVSIAIGIYIAPEFKTGWLLGSKSYHELGLPHVGGLVRLLIYASSTLLVISILAWAPSKKFSFTKLGARTLYVYLLHGFFVQLFRTTEILTVTNGFEMIGIVMLSAAIVWLLSSVPILGLFQPMIEGRTTIIEKSLER